MDTTVVGVDRRLTGKRGHSFLNFKTGSYAHYKKNNFTGLIGKIGFNDARKEK
jgi:hypothetical protein